MGETTLTSNNLRWLVCPACHKTLQIEGNVIRCIACNRRYPIIDGIPVLLEDRSL